MADKCTTSVPDGLMFAIQELTHVSGKWISREQEGGNQYSDQYPHGEDQLRNMLDRLNKVRAKLDRAEEKIVLHFAAVRNVSLSYEASTPVLVQDRKPVLVRDKKAEQAAAREAKRLAKQHGWIIENVGDRIELDCPTGKILDGELHARMIEYDVDIAPRSLQEAWEEAVTEIARGEKGDLEDCNSDNDACRGAGCFPETFPEPT